jgi:flagellar hook-associated protein 1 FlgK
VVRVPRGGPHRFSTSTRDAMTNWFASIGQASTGLNAARYGLTVVSQNIENADSDGYSHQTVQQAALVTPPSQGIYTSRSGLPGLNGVTVASTDRSDDPVLDARVRDEHARGSLTDTTASTMSSIEGLLGEPSTTGLSSQLTAYWGAWGTVANSPNSTAARSVLLQSANAVVTTLHSLSSSLSEVSTSTASSLDADLSQANSAAQRLATLNGQIGVATATGQNANSLMDSRDQLLDSLSKLVGGVASIASNGMASVTVGGQTLVSGTTASSISADASHQVSVGGSAVTLSGGSAASRVTTLTTTIPGYQAQLDAVATSLASTGNAVQSGGYDLHGNAGTALFSGSGAGGITVALTDPAGLAASATPGGNLDGSNALSASQLGSSTTGPDATFATMVGTIGSASALATQQQSTQDAVVSNVDALHASINGVSYDEEVSNMMTYQNAFSASSRVLTTIDEMLDTLINHTGVVGRG